MRKNDRGEKSSWPLWIGLVCLMAPVLYVLSAGPFIWLHANGYLTDRQQEMVILLYLPVRWTYEVGPEWWRSVLNAYAHLCGE